MKTPIAGTIAIFIVGMASVPTLAQTLPALDTKSWKSAQPVVPDLSSPETAVASFVLAFDGQSPEGLVACVKGAKMARSTKELMTSPGTNDIQITLSNVFVAQVAGQPNRRLVSYRCIVSVASRPEPATKGYLTVEKVGNFWKIIPNRLQEFEPVQTIPTAKHGTQPTPPPQPGFGQLAELTALVAHPKNVGVQIQSAPPKVTVNVAASEKPHKPTSHEIAAQKATLNNVHQICFGILWYLQDSHGVYRFTPETFHKTLAPVVKPATLFTSPLDKPGTLSYQFNPKLAGLMLKASIKPDTVMVYEGLWGQPLFRYNGLAVIGFVDGHASLFTPEQASHLKWNP